MITTLKCYVHFVYPNFNNMDCWISKTGPGPLVNFSTTWCFTQHTDWKKWRTSLTHWFFLLDYVYLLVFFIIIRRLCLHISTLHVHVHGQIKMKSYYLIVTRVCGSFWWAFLVKPLSWSYISSVQLIAHQWHLWDWVIYFCWNVYMFTYYYTFTFTITWLHFSNIFIELGFLWHLGLYMNPIYVFMYTFHYSFKTWTVSCLRFFLIIIIILEQYGGIEYIFMKEKGHQRVLEEETWFLAGPGKNTSRQAKIANLKKVGFATINDFVYNSEGFYVGPYLLKTYIILFCTFLK